MTTNYLGQLTTTRIQATGDDIYQDISDESHASHKHVSRGVDYLLHRLAGAQDNNSPGRTLAYSELQSEIELAKVVNTAVLKHQAYLVSASCDTMRSTRLELDMDRYRDESRHDPLNRGLDVDMELDYYDEDDDTPIVGKGVVYDGRDGRISFMVSSIFDVRVRTNTPRETEQAATEGARRQLPWLSLKTVTCDLERQLEENRRSAVMKRANEAMTPHVDLAGHIHRIPGQIANGVHRASMLMQADPDVSSEVRYMRTWDEHPDGQRSPKCQTIALTLDEATQSHLMLRFDNTDHDRMTMWLSRMSPRPAVIRTPSDLRAVLDIEATPKAHDDAMRLFCRLNEEGAIPNAFMRDFGLGRYESRSTPAADLDELRERVRARQAKAKEPFATPAPETPDAPQGNTPETP
jgi:hypothetical protein